ncbi:MAG: hypothetical protein JNL34_01290 [Anaerolineae bacterium]|nr:hypothetical protein [Anaerolineae bacterium]
MTRLGLWIILGVLAFAAVTLLPAIIGDDARDLQFAADILFCDGDQAVLSVNLSEAALAKGNLGSVLSGFCADSRGNRLAPIPASHFADWLTLLVGVGLIGILMIGLGVFLRAGRSAIVAVAAPGPSPASVNAARVRQRDAEDVAARSQANYQRSQIVPSVPQAKAAASTPDWMLGMPATGNASQGAASTPQRFDFGEATTSPPQTDLQTQLNMLQLAYESSLIWRSEYDARREALLRQAGIVSANQG